ncbi:hypothetical protein PTKIN_Ptkin09bG0007000 [Pterospermum kingtungense]
MWHVHGEGRKGSSVSACFAKRNIRENNAAQVKVVVKWKPLGDDYYKVNFDGALDIQEKRGGVGIVIRNSTAEVMGVLAEPLRGVNDPLLIEAYVAVRALEDARDLGLTKIVLEGDSAGMIN